MIRSHQLHAIFCLLGVLTFAGSSGCDRDAPDPASGTAAGNGPGSASLPGTPLAGPGLPAQMHGDWRFDRAQTLAALEAQASAPDATAEQKQQFAATLAIAAAMEQQGLPLHADIRVEPSRIVGHSSALQPQYDFTSLSVENGRAVGKAWYHEDRHDPGDMASEDLGVSITDDGHLVLELGPPPQASRFYFSRK